MTTPNAPLDTNLIRQIAFILLILFLGIVLARELWFFFPALLGAITFYVLMRGRMFFLVEKRGWKPARAAWVLMLLSFFVILVPIGILGNILYAKVSYLVTHSSELMATLKVTAARISKQIGYDLVKSDAINQIGPWLTRLLPKLLGITADTLALTSTLYFILYYMLLYGRQMEESLYEYIPLKDGNVELLGKELRTMVVANTIGIPLIAFIQGLVGLVGYLIIGIDEPWLWFAATCITAMLPVVGSAVVYVPLAVMLFAKGDTGKGIAMAVWGLLFIGLVDNVVRLFLNKKLGDIHPLITIFGVIVGVSLFGFIGLIFGPLLISMFIVLLRIYGNEFLLKRREMRAIR
ncbi:AI-2E family transporter [Flaviaesturariibacter aridisoli]|uniref:AI-2E family transporter n=1 Tax=Flaviaesturariibacter aridisoli TaxID=2545761 RepID=A0A4R4DZC5_9BACT|nr:AI-2E family transporter [Flaviaesturariibacter aridisoli]TCZ71774.1 AI-2E family transporter [Flaviaesturariibacter aridisoli]